MKELLIVDKLHKTFKLSAKQQKLEHTNSKVKVAVDGISFKAYEGEVFAGRGPSADLGVVEIVPCRVDGRDCAFIIFVQIRLVRIHGVEGEVVIGVGEIHPSVHLTEIHG